MVEFQTLLLYKAYILKSTGADSFDEEGTYVIKVALENGSSATATVKVAEMGDVVGIIALEKICSLLDMQPGNIIKYVEEEH